MWTYKQFCIYFAITGNNYQFFLFAVIIHSLVISYKFAFANLLILYQRTNLVYIHRTIFLASVRGWSEITISSLNFDTVFLLGCILRIRISSLKSSWIYPTDLTICRAEIIITNNYHSFKTSRMWKCGSPRYASQRRADGNMSEIKREQFSSCCDGERTAEQVRKILKTCRKCWLEKHNYLQAVSFKMMNYYVVAIFWGSQVLSY